MFDVIVHFATLLQLDVVLIYIESPWGEVDSIVYIDIYSRDKGCIADIQSLGQCPLPTQKFEKMLKF